MDRKTMMIIGGGVLLLAIVIIFIVLRKKGTPATTYPATTYPATTYPATTYPATTYPITTYPATTYPATTAPPPVMAYIKSTEGDYLVFNKGIRLSKTKNLSEATPVYLTICKSGYCLMTVDNLSISVQGGTNIVGYGQQNSYPIYMNSIAGPAYLSIVGQGWYLNPNTLTFEGKPNGNDSKFWMAVMI